jgi:hypothetical protein
LHKFYYFDHKNIFIFLFDVSFKSGVQLIYSEDDLSNIAPPLEDMITVGELPLAPLPMWCLMDGRGC